MINVLEYLNLSCNKNPNKIAVIENKLEIVMDNFIDPNTYKHYLIKDGEKIEADIIERDHRDMTREISPLRQADDAVLVDTSDMTIDEVVEKICSLCK